LPKKLHRKLARTAGKKGLTGRRKAAYIYGSPPMQKYLKKKRAKKKR